MTAIEKQITAYIDQQAASKKKDLQHLHALILALAPKRKLWFLDGTDAAGKQVSNPNIGYGTCTLKYADGSSKEFYKVGLSANSSGISMYLFDLPSKTFLQENYGKQLGKAKITGYCIKFKNLEGLNLEAVKAMLKACLQV